LKRIPKQRNTLYGEVGEETKKRSVDPIPLTSITNNLEDRKHHVIASSQ
jgi:hypothetical protein